jgi:hypothetical protein
MKTRRKRIRIGRKRRRAGTKRKRDAPTPRREPRRRLNPWGQAWQQEQQQQQPQGELNIINDDDAEFLLEIDNYHTLNTDADDPNFIQGGKRKKKTRKKRGGNTEEVNRQLRLLVDQVLQNHTRIQELEQWQEAYENMNLEERIEALERQRSGTGGTGGGKRKKKTRKKRGGMDEQPTPPQVPRDNDVGTKQYEPGQLGVQQPPQLPPFMLPPPANTEPVVRNRRAAIRMEGAPPHMRRSEDESAMLANRANERYRRRNRNYLRNLSGDLLERCTGNRCGLGGRRRKKKTRKKKNKKRRTKKKSRRRR